jgi:biotin carboxylase
MQNVVILAGGVWQYYLTGYMKEQGYRVTVVNPVVTDTTLLADNHIQRDVKDVEGIVQDIKSLSPLFVCSDQSDVTPIPQAKISKLLGLPCNDVEVIEKFTDKYKMWQHASSVGVSMPHTVIVTCASDIVKFAEEHGLPIVVKPADSNSSKGFTKLVDTKDAEEAFNTAALHSGKVMAQKYIAGRQVTLDGFCSGGKHRTLDAASIGFGFSKEGIISSVRYPFEEELLPKLIEMNDRFVDTSGLKFGMTHAEYRFNDDEVILLEIAARGGGSGTSSILTPWVTSVSLYDLLHRSLLGEVIDLDGLAVTKRPAWLEYFAFPPQMAHKDLERTMQRAKKVPHVAEFKFNFKLHEYMPPVTSGQQRHALAMILGDKECEMATALESIMDILRSEGWYEG